MTAVSTSLVYSAPGGCMGGRAASGTPLGFQRRATSSGTATALPCCAVCAAAATSRAAARASRLATTLSRTVASAAVGIT